MTERTAKKSKSIAGSTLPALERDLARCEKALGNKKLLPQSVIYYRRRRDLLEAEIAKRNVRKR